MAEHLPQRNFDRRSAKRLVSIHQKKDVVRRPMDRMDSHMTRNYAPIGSLDMLTLLISSRRNLRLSDCLFRKICGFDGTSPPGSSVLSGRRPATAALCSGSQWGSGKMERGAASAVFPGGHCAPRSASLPRQCSNWGRPQPRSAEETHATEDDSELGLTAARIRVRRDLAGSGRGGG